jgi:hypothetical protein
MKTYHLQISILVAAVSLTGCGKTSESGGGAPAGGNSKPAIEQNEQKVETDPMFKDANRVVAEVPEGVWTAMYEMLAKIQTITDELDKIPYTDVLRAQKKKTLNVKQPYEVVLVVATRLLKGMDEKSSVVRRGWVLPIYDGDRPIDSWGVGMSTTDDPQNSQWQVGTFGATPIDRYIAFEKAEGYWNTDYKKVVFPDITLTGKRYVGYFRRGHKLEDGRFYKDRDGMDVSDESLTWKQLLDRLCEDAEEKNRSIENGKRLRGIVDKKEAPNDNP